MTDAYTTITADIIKMLGKRLGSLTLKMGKNYWQNGEEFHFELSYMRCAMITQDFHLELSYMRCAMITQDFHSPLNKQKKRLLPAW